MNISEKPSIKWIHLNQLRNDAHFQYLTEFRALVEAIGIAILKIEALWPGFLCLYESLDAALKKIVKSALTERINEADTARDAVFAGLVKFHKVTLDHYDNAIREAAHKIDVVLHTYGNVAAKPINEETSAVYNFVQELKSAKYGSLVTLTGLMPWVNKLELLNNEFENLIQERDRESASKNHVAVKIARREIDDAYKHIVQTINSLIYLDMLTNCGTFVDTMNAIIHRFAAMIKRHSHSASGAETPAEDGTETTEGGSI